MHFYFFVSSDMAGEHGEDDRLEHIKEGIEFLRTGVEGLQDIDWGDEIEANGSHTMLACFEMHPVKQKCRIRYYADCFKPTAKRREGRVLLDFTDQPLDITQWFGHIERFMATGENPDVIRGICRKECKRLNREPRVLPLLKIG
jgi:hypothetical protein